MVNASFVFGLDDDGPDVFDRTVDWAVSQSIETATFHIMTPYPGTALHDRVAAEGRITDTDWDHYDTRHVVYRPRRMTPDELLAGYRRAYRDFYAWGSILRGAAGQATLHRQARHLAYAGGWKRLEPFWDAVIRSRRVSSMLPLLEATLDAFGRARTRRGASGGEDSPSANRTRIWRGHARLEEDGLIARIPCVSPRPLPACAMLIKAADSRQPQIDALDSLVARPDVDVQTRRQIEQEVRIIRAGARGERDAAYEIEFLLGGDPNRMTIDDLRLGLDGRVAQIDHLILNRILEVRVCESKHFSDGVSSDRGGHPTRPAVSSRGGRARHAAPPRQTDVERAALLPLSARIMP